MLGNLEKVERELYRPCRNLIVKNVVHVAFKGFNGKCYGGVYMSNYRSQKYSDRESLGVLRITTSDFLVFTYRNSDEFNEVYCSYPHLPRLLEGFREAYNMLVSEEYEDLFVEEGNELYLNADYSNLQVKIEGLANGNSILLVPNVVGDENEGEREGVLLYLGSEDYVVEMDYEELEALVHFLEKFNLQESSQSLLLMASLSLLLNGDSGGGTSNSLQEQKRSGPPKRKILNRTVNRKRTTRTARKPTPAPEQELSDKEDDEDDVIFYDSRVEHPDGTPKQPKEIVGDTGDLFDDEEDEMEEGSGPINKNSLLEAMADFEFDDEDED